MESSTRVYRATGTAQAAIILAPGAGAGQGHPFMVGYARALAGSGFDVVTFDFPYMREGRRVPDPAPVLEAAYRSAIAWTRQEHVSAHRGLFIGGKSMGGRIATQVAASDPTLPIAGLVLLGYPLHPPGRPEKRRDAHLPRLGRPALFIQGSRDTFGSPDELREALTTVVPAPTLHIVEGGDHSFKVSRAARSAASAPADIDAAIQAVIVGWMAGIVG
ncbi:MAG: alpha/beta fold hydrolase [Vicinamibacterales bacterium]